MAVRVKLNSRTLDALLKDDAVQADLRSRAGRIAAAAGPGHEVSVVVGRTRARASVATATAESRRAEATDRTLTRAIDAGR